MQINYGGPVPKSYYVRDSQKVTYDTSVSIGRGSVFDLEYDITAAGSVLRYAVSPPRLVRPDVRELLLSNSIVTTSGAPMAPSCQTCDVTNGPDFSRRLVTANRQGGLIRTTLTSYRRNQ